MSEQPDDPRHWRNWISAGDILTAAMLLAAMAAGWGSISKDVTVLRDDIADLKSQRMTAGAAEAIAAMTQKDLSQDRDIAEFREELRAHRREIMDSLLRLEAEIKSHDRRAR